MIENIQFSILITPLSNTTDFSYKRLNAAFANSCLSVGFLSLSSEQHVTYCF